MAQLGVCMASCSQSQGRQHSWSSSCASLLAELQAGLSAVNVLLLPTAFKYDGKEYTRWRGQEGWIALDCAETVHAVRHLSAHSARLEHDMRMLMRAAVPYSDSPSECSESFISWVRMTRKYRLSTRASESACLPASSHQSSLLVQIRSYGGQVHAGCRDIADIISEQHSLDMHPVSRVQNMLYGPVVAAFATVPMSQQPLQKVFR